MLSSQLQGWFKEGTAFILIVDPLWDLARDWHRVETQTKGV